MAYRKLQDLSFLQKVSHVIMDEVHERQVSRIDMQPTPPTTVLSYVYVLPTVYAIVHLTVRFL